MLRSSSVALSPNRTISLWKFGFAACGGGERDRRYVENRMPRRADLGREIPSVLMQSGGLPAHGDLGIRHHSPDHFDRLIAAHGIRDQHSLPLRHAETPQPLLDPAAVRAGQIDLHPAEIGREFLTRDAGFGARDPDSDRR